MKTVNKDDFVDYPAGTVFAEYKPKIHLSDVMVKHGHEFGATNVVPVDGEVNAWDWSIWDYDDSATFAIFDEREILFMVKTLLNAVSLIPYDGEEVE